MEWMRGSGDGFVTLVELRCDGVDIVDAAAPDTSAGMDESGPQPRVIRKFRVWREVMTRPSLGEKLRSNVRAHRSI